MRKRPRRPTKEELRAFLDRPWHVFEAQRLAEDRRRFEADPSSAPAEAEVLSDEVRAAQGEPHPDLRRIDFEDHVRLRALLDRAGRSGGS